MLLIIKVGHECSQALAYRDHVNNGLQLLESHTNDLAQIEFSLSITANPTCADPYFYRGLSEARQSNTTAARKDFDKAIQLDGKNPRNFMARAWLCNSLKEYDAAIEDCDRTLKLDPSYWDAFRLSANAYSNLGQYSQAVTGLTTFLNQYQQTDNRRADALAKRAFAFDQTHDLHAAIKDYSDAIAYDRQNASLYASRAVVYMQLHNWTKSLGDCNMAIQLKHAGPSLYKVRAICYQGLGRSKDCLRDLDKLVKSLPTVDTHRTRGDARLVAQDYAGTLEDFDYVLQAEPADRTTYVKYQKAKRNLQATAKITGSVNDAEPRASMPSPTALRQPQPVLVKNGYELTLSGDNEAAIAYLTAAVKSNAADPIARRYLAYALVKNGQGADAIAQLNVLAKLQRPLPTDQLMCAEALTACKLNPEAIDAYNRILDADPQNDRARAELIMTLLKNGLTEQAAIRAAEGMQRSPSMRTTYSKLMNRAIADKNGKPAI